MAKQILPKELAEIVTGLLVAPQMLGELKSADQHQDFMLAIGKVVASFCGGEANWVNPPDFSEDEIGECEDGLTQPMLSVAPNDSLPSFNRNVWSLYDPDGWEGESVDGLECDVHMSKFEIAQIRSRLQSLLARHSLSEYGSLYFEYQVQDWRVAEGVELEGEGDDRPYNVKALIGNQTNLTFKDENGMYLGLLIEINQGVPALHIDLDGKDDALHIHRAQGGLVLTPSSPNNWFEQAANDRFAYNEYTSIVIK